MPVATAGILLFRRDVDGVRVLLVHPGGPFWRRKDVGAWMMPKGEIQAGETPLEAALREFREETGWAPPGTPVPLGEVRQPGGKTVLAWAIEGDADPATLVSNTFEMEWPRGSGQAQTFPEVDRAAWFDLEDARRRMLPSQQPLLDALERLVQARP